MCGDGASSGFGLVFLLRSAVCARKRSALLELIAVKDAYATSNNDEEENKN